MKTECKLEKIGFHGLRTRNVVGHLDCGQISSDGGGILLRDVNNRTQILKSLSQSFSDFSNAELIENTLESLIKQRVNGLALGYVDLNEQDELRQDALLVKKFCKSCGIT